jgi:hypothetical protein
MDNPFGLVPHSEAETRLRNDIGETLGLYVGARPLRSEDDVRCGACLQMVSAGSWVAWLPVDVHPRDGTDVIEEIIRYGRSGGHFVIWCRCCATRPVKPAPRTPFFARAKSEWRAVWRWLRGRP